MEGGLGLLRFVLWHEPREDVNYEKQGANYDRIVIFAFKPVQPVFTTVLKPCLNFVVLGER
jgi:hypothetical protein